MVKEVTDSFDEADAESIEQVQSLLRDDFDDVKDDLAFIKANFAFIPDAITAFESTTLIMSEGLQTYEDIRQNLYSMNSPICVRKFDKIVGRNANYERLKIVRNILAGRKEENENCAKRDIDFVRNYSASELAMFKHIPLSSCDVERTFSLYKSILTDHRRSFLFENLKQLSFVAT